MNELQNKKYAICISSEGQVDNAAHTSTVVDTLGYDEATFIVHVGTTDVALAALKVQESDTKTDATTLASGADVTGLVWGTSTDPDSGSTSSLPSASDGTKLFAAHIKLNNRKRYLQIQATSGNGTTGTAVNAYCILNKAGEGPYNATTRGLGSNLIA